MTVLHTGSTKKFASGWENIFSGKRGRGAELAASPAGKKSSASKASRSKRTSGARKRTAGKKRARSS